MRDIYYTKSAVDCILENLDIVNKWIMDRAERIAKNRGLRFVERQDIKQAINEYLDHKLKEV